MKDVDRAVARIAERPARSGNRPVNCIVLLNAVALLERAKVAEPSVVTIQTDLHQLNVRL